MSAEFRNLLSHEVVELLARAKSSELDVRAQQFFYAKAQGVAHALEMFDALASGQRPAGGICSIGAHYFYVYGELLPVGKAECFAAKAPDVRLEEGAVVKFHAVHQLEGDEGGVFHLRREPAMPRVGDDDCSFHGDSFQ